MKRTIVVGAAIAALLPGIGSAADCKPATDYKVGHISYKPRSPAQSLERLLRATPYQGVMEGDATRPVKARRIAGPLSLSLDHLAEQTGMSWQQHGCQVRFTAKRASAAAAVRPSSSHSVAANVAAAPSQAPVMKAAPSSGPDAWNLVAHQPIHQQFADWARIAGWTFEWRLEKSWLVPAATQFTGTFDEALAKAIEALHAQGKPVRLILWEGNRFAEIVDVDAR